MDDYDDSAWLRTQSEYWCFHRRPRHKPTRLFVSYATADKNFRDRLLHHLSPLIQANLIDVCHDGELLPDRSPLDPRSRNLADADIILLLVTPAFLTSDHLWGTDIEVALAHNQANVVPVIVIPVDWEGTPFAGLEPLPEGGRPVVTWPDEDAAWADVAEGVRCLAAWDKGGMGGKAPAVVVYHTDKGEKEVKMLPLAYLRSSYKTGGKGG